MFSPVGKVCKSWNFNFVNILNGGKITSTFDNNLNDKKIDVIYIYIYIITITKCKCFNPQLSVMKLNYGNIGNNFPTNWEEYTLAGIFVFHYFENFQGTKYFSKIKMNLRFEYSITRTKLIRDLF